MRNLLIAIFALQFLFYSLPSRAYITAIQKWENRRTGQVIYLYGDSHNVGTVEENIKQSQYFINSVLTKVSAREAPVKVLVEAQALFYLDFERYYEETMKTYYTDRNSYGSLYFCPLKREFLSLKCTKDNASQTTWIIGLFYDAQDVIKQNKNINIKSIDPRFGLRLWEVQSEFASFKAIFELGKEVPEINKYMADEGHKHDSLYTVLSDLQENLDVTINRVKDALSLVPGSEKEETVLSKTLGELRSENLITNYKWKRVFEALQRPEDTSYALDKVALWEASKKHHKIQFFLVGFYHMDNISNGLAAIGYEKVDESKPPVSLFRIPGQSENLLQLEESLTVEIEGAMTRMIFDVNEVD